MSDEMEASHISPPAPQTADTLAAATNSAATPEQSRQSVIFASLFAVASLLAAWPRLAGEVEPSLITLATDLSIALAALAVLVRPTWYVPFVALSFFHLASGLIAMPRLSAAQLLWMFCGATIVTSYLTGCIVHRSYRQSMLPLQRSFAPSLRVMLVISLATFGLARLNWGFLQLETSSVISTLSAFRGQDDIPEWVLFITMSMLIVGDLFLAFALLLPSLRRFAVALCCGYFAWQALIGFEAARSLLPLIFIILYLFTATESTTRICEITVRWVPWRAVRSFGLAVVSVVLLAAAAAAWMDRARGTSQMYGQTIFVSYYVGFVLIWSTCLACGLTDPRQPRLTKVAMLPRNPLHYAIVLTLATAGTFPYLGLGTQATLSSEHGLVTELGTNNHLFVPQTYLVEYQTDLVEILDSSDPYLAGLAQRQDMITWFELVNYLSRRPDTSLSFIRGGERFEVAQAGAIAELSRSNSWILSKLLGFRTVRRKAVLALHPEQLVQP